MVFDNISDELKEKAKACKTPEEVLELAKTEGYELSEDELDAVVGGRANTLEWGCEPYCPAQICRIVCNTGSTRQARRHDSHIDGLM